jgi:hypothetical protein
MGKITSGGIKSAGFLASNRPWVPHPKSKREREREAAANRPVVPAAPPPVEEPREPAADTRFNQPD